jgi:hypothetical protein
MEWYVVNGSVIQILFQVTIAFFQKTYKKDLSAEGQWEFLNMWYIMIVVNDILIILGSAIKEQIERKVSCNIRILYVCLYEHLKEGMKVNKVI